MSLGILRRTEIVSFSRCSFKGVGSLGNDGSLLELTPVEYKH